LLKTLKITTKTSANTNQSAICFDDELKKFLRPGKTPFASPVLILALGVQTRNGRHLFVASKQDTHRWLAPILLNFDLIAFSPSAYFSPGLTAVIKTAESLTDLLTNPAIAIHPFHSNLCNPSLMSGIIPAPDPWVTFSMTQ
jgi:hypothetical protein